MKRLFCTMLAGLLLLGLAACAGDTDSQASSQASAPASQPQASSAPQAESVAEEDEWIVLNQSFLTGEPKGPDYPEGKRITGVMVNNIASARPAYGLSDAKVVVEIKVEGGITRFMALFEDYRTMPRVGSLRSARDQFLQLLIPYWGFYVHEGPDQNQPTNWMLRDYEYDEYDFQPKDYGGLIWREHERDGSTYGWHNISGETLTEAIEYKGSDDYRSYGEPIFNFVSFEEEPRIPTEGASNEITVPHSTSYLTYFDYDKASARYEMSMFNSYNGRIEETVDGNNNERVAFDNVLVLFAPMSLYAGSPLVEVDYSQGGAGYLFTQGGWELVIWRKGAANERLYLEYLNYTSEADRFVQLNPGTTYLAMVDDDELPDFADALSAGSMGGITGEVNTEQVDTED